MSSPAEEMRRKLRDDLAQAMATREAARVSLLRALIAAIDNAEAVEVVESGPYREHKFGDPATETARKALDAFAVAQALEADARERETAAGHCQQAGRADRAEVLRAEAAVVRGYLAR